MRVGRREQETERSSEGERARGEAGQVVCCVCVWVGETRLTGACGGVGCVCVCVSVCE